jgi:hypothetical protein
MRADSSSSTCAATGGPLDASDASGFVFSELAVSVDRVVFLDGGDPATGEADLGRLEDSPLVIGADSIMGDCLVKTC